MYAKAGKRKFDSCVVARVFKMIAAPELLSEFLESETRLPMQPINRNRRSLNAPTNVAP